MTDSAAPTADPTLELAGFLPYRLSVLSNLVSDAIARQYQERVGLTIPEWRIIAVLGSFGPMAANEVCARTYMDKVMVSRTLAKLVARKLVIRRTDRADRRRSALSLSAKGEAIRAEVTPLALGLERQLTQSLSDADRRALDGLIERLMVAVKRLHPDFGNEAP